MPPPERLMLPEIVLLVTVSTPALWMASYPAAVRYNPERTKFEPPGSKIVYRFLPFIVTNCVKVAPLPVVGPRILVFVGRFRVPVLLSMIVLAEAAFVAAKTVGSNEMSAPDVLAAAAASASRRLQLWL